MDPICLNCGKPIFKDKRSKKLRSTRFHQGCRTLYREKLKPVKCKCGCGEMVKPMDENGLFHEFKAGHYARTQDFTGSNNPKFNGYKCMTQNGYVLIRCTDHPFADNRGYVPEHHLVWEEYNKAIILPWGVIHHKNHIRDDNRIDNLESMTKLSHDYIESCARQRDNLGRFV